jgi:predicted ABC-type ATPase
MPPDFYLFGGPNGAGKTTLAMKLLPSWGCYEFLNADLIARGLSPFEPDGVALQAGQIMMRRTRDLLKRRITCATESTLSASALVPLLEECQASCGHVHLIYVWLPTADMAVERVAARVRAGGHYVPEETVRRRYEAGRRNFIQIYSKVVDGWRVVDNSSLRPKTIATGDNRGALQVYVEDIWQRIAHE